MPQTLLIAHHSNIGEKVHTTTTCIIMQLLGVYLVMATELDLAVKTTASGSVPYKYHINMTSSSENYPL